MSVALKVLFAIVLVCYFGISAGKLPSINACKKGKHGVVDCRGIGFQNVPYDIFSIPKVKIYLSGNPLICDCSFVWFLREPSANKKRIVDYNSMKCANSKMKGYLVKKITSESQICKTKQIRSKDYCRVAWGYLTCMNSQPPRIPFDIFTAGGKMAGVEGQFPCDCDTVWFIRRLRMPEQLAGNKRRFVKPKEIMCKADKAKGMWKPVPAYKVAEAKICPQKAHDSCKANPCPAKVTTCKNTAKSYECIDIDECSTGNYKCGEKEECYNKENGYECRCVEGFTRKEGKCIANLDPCKAKPPVCDIKIQRCVSTNWTFYECLDLDECLTQKHDCDKNAKCINTEPGFKCQCKSGFKKYDNGRECKDLNECSNKRLCSKHAKCTNLPGSYKCECNPGYSGDGKFCKSNDKCKSNTKCSVDAICKNKGDTYECTCKKGYHGSGKTCKDVNECTQKKFKCPSHSKCHNTRGSYTCKCRHGYKLKKGRCLDVNECKVNSHNCHKNALCINSVGGYNCRCKEGFKHLKNGRLCLKEEEKSEGDNKIIIIIAVSASLLLVVIISCCVCCRRRNNKGKKTGKKNNGEEFKKLLGNQISQDYE